MVLGIFSLQTRSPTQFHSQPGTPPAFAKSSDGIITTVAGNGTDGFSGDGGPAINAGLSAFGVAVDSAGNLFIADTYNSRIRKVSSSGIITTVAGNGGFGYSGDGGPAINAPLYFSS